MKLPEKIVVNGNIWKLLGALITVMTISYAFYYDTNHTLQTNSASIKEIQADIEHITEVVNDNSSFRGVSENEFKSINERVKSIDQKQDMMIELMTNYIISTNK